jgi:hypothetical protein
VDKKSGARLTGPVNHGVLSKVNCFAQTRPQPCAAGFCVEAWRTTVARSCNGTRKYGVSPWRRAIGPAAADPPEELRKPKK